jgi:hypothetical protein
MLIENDFKVYILLLIYISKHQSNKIEHYKNQSPQNH